MAESTTEAALIRTVRFRAEHRYGRSDWPRERNEAVFGAENLRAHGHEYAVEVTVRGPVDADTGFVAPLGELDGLLADEVVGRLDGRSLNESVPAFREGALQPSTEALAGWIWGRLRGRIPGGARLVRIRVFESDELGAEVSEG